MLLTVDWFSLTLHVIAVLFMLWVGVCVIAAIIFLAWLIPNLLTMRRFKR